MAKNILQGIRGTASSHPVAHMGQSGLETKTFGETESELLTYLLQLAAVVLGCLSAATYLLLCLLKHIFLDTERSGKWPIL